MNLEIASRLVGLRRENNLSQEALAEKLGISRQAVSKWERAEASPDTDNLIALAKLYHVSLDELLMIHGDEADENITLSEQKEETRLELERSFVSEPDTGNFYDQTKDGRDENRTEPGTQSKTENTYDTEEDVHVGFDGIHVKDKDAEVHVSWHGIHVHDMKNDNEVHIDKNGVYVNGDKASKHMFSRGKGEELPLGIIAIIAYIVIGACFNLWHPGWLIFFLVPVISTLIDAVRRQNPNFFAYPVLAVLIFLFVGLVYGIWHPTWVVFLTIPIYYSIAGYIVRTFTKDGTEEADTE